MRVNVFSGALTKLQTHLLAVTCFEDIRPLQGLAATVDWYYGGLLSRTLQENRFTGGAGKTLLLDSSGKLLIPKVVLLGLGQSQSYDYPQLKFISSVLYRVLKGLRIHECAFEVEVPMARPLDSLQLIESFLSAGDFDHPKASLEITFIVKESDRARIQQKYMHTHVQK